jgi:hypothetical protein
VPNESSVLNSPLDQTDGPKPENAKVFGISRGAQTLRTQVHADSIDMAGPPEDLAPIEAKKVFEARRAIDAAAEPSLQMEGVLAAHDEHERLREQALAEHAMPASKFNYPQQAPSFDAIPPRTPVIEPHPDQPRVRDARHMNTPLYPETAGGITVEHMPPTDELQSQIDSANTAPETVPSTSWARVKKAVWKRLRKGNHRG